MNVAEELREHAKRVERGWVRHAPNQPGEACAELWEDEEDWHCISDEAAAAVQEIVGCQPVLWNDRKPSEGGPVNRRQVAAVLRRAADTWEREQL